MWLNPAFSEAHDFSRGSFTCFFVFCFLIIPSFTSSPVYAVDSFNSSISGTVTEQSNQPSVNNFPAYIRVEEATEFTSGTGVLKIKSDNIDGKEDIGFFNQSDTALKYYWIKFDTSANIYEARVLDTFTRDGNSNIYVHYGDGDTDYSTTVTDLWSNVDEIHVSYGFNSSTGDFKDRTSSTYDFSPSANLSRDSPSILGSRIYFRGDVYAENSNVPIPDNSESDSFTIAFFSERKNFNRRSPYFRTANSGFQIYDYDNPHTLQHNAGDDTEKDFNIDVGETENLQYYQYRQGSNYDVFGKNLLNDQSGTITYAGSVDRTGMRLGSNYGSKFYQGYIDEFMIYTESKGDEWFQPYYDMTSLNNYSLYSWGTPKSNEQQPSQPSKQRGGERQFSIAPG